MPSPTEKPQRSPRHLVYLDAFLGKRMASPYNIVWTLREGARLAGLEQDIEFICGNQSVARPQSSEAAKTSLGRRDAPPSAIKLYWKHEFFFTKVYRTFFDRKAKGSLGGHADSLLRIDDMGPPHGRIDPFMEEARSIHCFSTLDALRLHNYLVRINKRHKVRLILSFYTPGWPAHDWVRGRIIDGFFPFATRKLLDAHSWADAEALRVSDILIFPSEQSLESYHWENPGLKSILRFKDVRYVPFGSTPLVPTVSREDVRKALNLNDKFIVSFVGQHSSFLGYDDLKAAGRKLLDKHADLAFLIGGPQRPLAGLDHPRWFECGVTREMDNLIEASDVFVAPNQQSYFNPIILEAMSRGKMIVARRIGWNHILGEASAGVKLFSSAEELAVAIEAFHGASAEERKAFAEANRKLYEEKYTAATFAEAYNQTIQQIHRDYRLVPVAAPRTDDTKTPEISVIIPVGNTKEYLGPCLDSILNQTFEDFEILAVYDDGCTDGSQDLLAEYAARDSRVRIINGGSRRGMGFARNHGLDAARGNYIAFIDSDDLMEHNMLELMHDCCVSKDVPLATCAFSFLDGGTNRTYFHSTFETLESLQKYYHDGVIDLSDHVALGVMFLVTWNMLYHRSLFDNVRYTQNYEDISTSVELLAKLDRIGHVPLPLYYYRLDNPTRMVNNASPRILDIFHITEIIKSAMYEVMEEDDAREAYIRLAIRAIRFRATLAKSPEMRRMFWRRTERFLRQERLDFERLMEGIGYEFPVETMLEFYRPTAWQRRKIRREYFKNRERWNDARFRFDPILHNLKPILRLFDPLKKGRPQSGAALEALIAFLQAQQRKTSTGESLLGVDEAQMYSLIKAVGQNKK